MNQFLKVMVLDVVQPCDVTLRYINRDKGFKENDDIVTRRGLAWPSPTRHTVITTNVLNGFITVLYV